MKKKLTNKQINAYFKKQRKYQDGVGIMSVKTAMETLDIYHKTIGRHDVSGKKDD